MLFLFANNHDRSLSKLKMDKYELPVQEIKTATELELSNKGLGKLDAIVMAVLSGAAGVYTELIMKKRPQRNVNVQNVYLYMFGVIFNIFAIFLYDYDAVFGNGFFHGYNGVVCVMIVNHALSGIAVSLVMKYADNIVKARVVHSHGARLEAVALTRFVPFQASLSPPNVRTVYTACTRARILLYKKRLFTYVLRAASTRA